MREDEEYEEEGRGGFKKNGVSWDGVLSNGLVVANHEAATGDSGSGNPPSPSLSPSPQRYLPTPYTYNMMTLSADDSRLYIYILIISVLLSTCILP